MGIVSDTSKSIIGVIVLIAVCPVDKGSLSTPAMIGVRMGSAMLGASLFIISGTTIAVIRSQEREIRGNLYIALPVTIIVILLIAGHSKIILNADALGYNIIKDTVPTGAGPGSVGHRRVSGTDHWRLHRHERGCSSRLFSAAVYLAGCLQRRYRLVYLHAAQVYDGR